MKLLKQKLAHRNIKHGVVMPICVGLRDATPVWIAEVKSYLRSQCIPFEHRVKVKGEPLPFNGVLYIRY